MNTLNIVEFFQKFGPPGVGWVILLWRLSVLISLPRRGFIAALHFNFLLI